MLQFESWRNEQFHNFLCWQCFRSICLARTFFVCVFRKRLREDEIGDGEFFPLSKRITQLRIHTEYPHLMNNQITPKLPTSKHDIETIAQQHSYAPELTLQENPHYYRSNKILFDAFQERKTRLEHENSRIILWTPAGGNSLFTVYFLNTKLFSLN